MQNSRHLDIVFAADQTRRYRMDLAAVQEIIHLDGPFAASTTGTDVRIRQRTVRIVPPARLGVRADKPRRLVIFELDHRLHGLPVWDATVSSPRVRG